MVKEAFGFQFVQVALAQIDGYHLKVNPKVQTRSPIESL